MQTFELTRLISQREASNKLYLEFLKVPDLSLGLYVLPVGGADPQSPHTEDEVYYVVSGTAQIKVADEDRAVQAGFRHGERKTNRQPTRLGIGDSQGCARDNLTESVIIST